VNLPYAFFVNKKRAALFGNAVRLRFMGPLRFRRLALSHLEEAKTEERSDEEDPR